MAIPRSIGEAFDQTLKVLRDPLHQIALLEVEEEDNERKMYVISLIQENGEAVRTLPLALMPFYVRNENDPANNESIEGFRLIPPDGAEALEAGESSSVHLPDDLVDRFEAPEEIACSGTDWDEEDE